MARTIQHRFTQGELDPKLLGRSDLDQYFGAAETMENVITLPQGGFKRRGGLEHIDIIANTITRETAPTATAPNGGTASNANDNNTATLVTTTNNISTTNPYVVVHYDLGSAKLIGYIDAVGAYLSAGASATEFKIQASTDNVTFTTLGTIPMTTTAYTQRVEVNATYRYVRFARIGATDLTTSKANIQEMHVWIDDAVVSDVRIINFEFNSEQSYILVLTDENIAVYRDGVFKVNIRAAGLLGTMLADINWAQSADTLIIFHEDLNPILVQRNGSDILWLYSNLTFDATPFHAFTEVSQTGTALGMGTMTPSATTGTITLTFSSGTLPAGTANQYFEGNGGRARVLSAVSATVVNAYVEIPFYSTSAVAAADTVYFSGYEATWSTARGWPICGTFHTGRLWIGGSKSRPTTAWGSRVGLFYDFSLGTSLDDEGIEITLDTDQLNRITNLYSGRNLMLFTIGAEFIIPTQLNEPITPSNVSAVRQSRVGSQRGLRVQEIEGAVYYIQNGGQSVQGFIFSDTVQAYLNELVSLLSGHLVVDPVDVALRRATSLDDGALYTIVREDGEVTIATIQRSQQITSFTNHTTDGEFLATGADYNDLYFAVQRTINSVTRNYLERMNEDHLLDASTRVTSGLPLTTFTGLTQLEAEECRVVADGSVLGRETPSGGSVTIDRAATTYMEIGLFFQPVFKDLPVEFPEQKTTLGKLLNLAEVILRLSNTVSIKVNGKNIQFRGFGLSGSGSPLGSPPPQFTGIKRLLGFRGWDYTAQVTITQDEPAPMTILAMSKRIIQGD